MKANLLVLFFLLSSVYAYSVVPLPVEKSSRATICIADSLQLGEQKGAYLTYKVGTVNKVAILQTEFNTTFSSSWLRNANFSFFINPFDGNYSLYLPGQSQPVLWGYGNASGTYDDGTTSGNFEHPGPSPTVRGPYLLTSAPALKSTVHWVVESNYLRVDRYLSIYSDRADAELQIRVSPKMESIDLESSSFDAVWLDRTDYPAVHSVTKDGTYLGGWGTTIFDDGEPWVSASSAAGSSIGVGFDQPFWVNKSDGYLVPNETLYLSNSSGTSLSKKLSIIYSNQSANATRLAMLGKGLTTSFNLSAWDYTDGLGFGHNWSNITVVSADLNFTYVRPEIEPTIATFVLDVKYANNTYPLVCDLNGNSLFSWMPQNNTVKSVSFDPAWLRNEGENNTLSCTAPFNQINMTGISLRKGHMSKPSAYSGFPFWKSLPIRVSNDHPSQIRVPNVTLEISKLGIFGIPTSSFVLLDESGRPCPLEAGSMSLTFSTSLPPNATNTFYLFFSESSLLNHETAGDILGTFSVTNFQKSNNVVADLGELAFISPPHRISSASSPSQRIITPGVTTQIAKRMVFDEESSRAAIVKLTVWRKA